MEPEHKNKNDSGFGVTMNNFRLRWGLNQKVELEEAELYCSSSQPKTSEMLPNLSKGE